MIAAFTATKKTSTRIPQKATKPFCGKSLLEWCFIQMKYSKLIDEIYITTDDPASMVLAEKHGVHIFEKEPWESEGSAGPTMSKTRNKIMDIHGQDLEWMVEKMFCHPLLLPGNIDTAIEQSRSLNRPCELLAIFEGGLFLNRTIGHDRFVRLFGTHLPIFGRAELGVTVLKPGRKLPVPKGAKTPDPIWHIASERAEMIYVAAREWQALDIDFRWQFEMGELLMEHFILRGKGDRVYKEYYEGNLKPDAHYIESLRRDSDL